ncbi:MULTISPECIES: LysE family translocator [Thalassospira]|jgi:threonine/homoserine/homoserine lactone efflux protein|uniref:Lysine transporter LysE n=1 Tax=Thalassospira xiamenensis TaxID=220697 RepID=A0ABR5XWS1_9PROT|nr:MULTISPECIES: LysE family translocator [Thalassospira]MBL4841990.1 LysE family translocator [Thalassospira sp.]MBR9779553.1 LysE family translocator [Rhodospirillales bacterium]HBX36014.1 LysE family translocator [Pseudohongiella sp.]KZC96791.1 lysine transporter LysE [Thalassospira xiamenensis]KZD04415.1 lysine transporter LysE [Thalassospira xiamenensis]|tara:strand:+ start:1330 stop:1944 length:615 start_codon:yes stop_codon:yes gene_type:complete
MLEISSLIIFAGALLVASGSPGPSVAALVARVLARGYRDILPFLAALWIGELIWLSFAVLGLSAIANSFHLLFTIIKYVGVVYLLYLAWKMWHAPVDVDAETIPDTKSGVRMFIAGMTVTMGNPKIMLFYMALVPTVIDLASVSLFGWFELSVALMVVLVAVDLTWVFMASRLRHLIRSRRAMKIANRTSATVMAGAAVAIASR